MQDVARHLKRFLDVFGGQLIFLNIIPNPQEWDGVFSCKYLSPFYVR
jgi:hypothetical protein